MHSSDLCTEQEISDMVHSFYARIRQDEVLGPVFNAHIQDWDQHLLTLIDFWSAILRGSRRFAGAPMPKHFALPNLSTELFDRWLALFRETTSAQPNRAMGERAYGMAQRIAQSFWHGYQLGHDPDGVPTKLRNG